MNFSEVMKALNNASSFELFRIRAAVCVALDEPARLEAIRRQLQLGQMIEYFDPRANAPCYAKVLELRRKVVLALNRDDGRRWLIDYASINLAGADVRIQQTKPRGLGRNEISVGEMLGFISRDGVQCSGRVVRLNDKTATLQTGNQQWRVGYVFLHRIMEGDILEQPVRSGIEYDITPED